VGRTCLAEVSNNLRSPGYICVFSLLSGRPSALISPRLTAYSVCNLSTKLRKRACFIWPMGRRTARTLAGATGDSWSSILTTSGIQHALGARWCSAICALWGSWRIHSCFASLSVCPHREACGRRIGLSAGISCGPREALTSTWIKT
jgi:hypothetical protein